MCRIIFLSNPWRDGRPLISQLESWDSMASQLEPSSVRGVKPSISLSSGLGEKGLVPPLGTNNGRVPTSNPPLKQYDNILANTG